MYGNWNFNEALTPLKRVFLCLCWITSKPTKWNFRFFTVFDDSAKSHLINWIPIFSDIVSGFSPQPFTRFKGGVSQQCYRWCATNFCKVRTGVIFWHILIFHKDLSSIEAPYFPVYIMGVYKWNTCLCMPLGCAVHHLACTLQPREKWNGPSVSCCNGASFKLIRWLWGGSHEDNFFGVFECFILLLDHIEHSDDVRVAEPEEVHVVRDPGAAVLPDGRGAGEQHRARENTRGWYVPKGKFPLNVSVNAAISIVISLWLNCLDFLMNQASHSRNGLQPQLMIDNASVDADTPN